MSDENMEMSIPVAEQLKIKMRKDFEVFLDQSANGILDKVLSEINGVVEEVIRDNPLYDNPLTRFNLGQSLVMDVIAGFKHLLEQKEIMLIASMNTAFVSTTSAKQIIGEKMHKGVGIG